MDDAPQDVSMVKNIPNPMWLPVPKKGAFLLMVGCVSRAMVPEAFPLR
jgi:hypothetical protein